jgi:outer membrane lipoprotein-sorting protein
MIALALGALFALGEGRVAQAAESQPEPQTADFVLPATAPVTLASVLAQFERYDAELASLTTLFSQTLEMTDSPLHQSVEGRVSYGKTERFRIEHLKPERQTIVSDGLDVWVHRHDRDQVVQAKLADWRAADPTIDNLLRFGRYAEMLETYAVELDTGSVSPTLILSPKEKGAEPFTLRLTLAKSTLFPESADMAVGAVRIRTRFSETLFNPEIDPQEFAFTPPPDADIFRNFKPPRFSP